MARRGCAAIDQQRQQRPASGAARPRDDRRRAPDAAPTHSELRAEAARGSRRRSRSRSRRPLDPTRAPRSRAAVTTPRKRVERLRVAPVERRVHARAQRQVGVGQQADAKARPRMRQERPRPPRSSARARGRARTAPSASGDRRAMKVWFVAPRPQSEGRRATARDRCRVALPREGRRSGQHDEERVERVDALDVRLAPEARGEGEQQRGERGRRRGRARPRGTGGRAAAQATAAQAALKRLMR